MKIRKADINDALLLADLGSKTFYDTYHEYNSVDDMEQYLASHFSISHLEQELSDSSNAFFIAERDNTVIGYIKISETVPPKEIIHLNTLEISRIYAVQAVHGKGVGASLLKKAVEIAIKKNKDVIWLGVWQKNDKAFRFYKKNGFVIVGSQQFALGTDVQDDWIMAKYLD
jgi:ribosomal protein S18 acetylase RimI-like enzyme